jgi:hypothetical protein
MTFISAHKQNEANLPKIEGTVSKNVKTFQYFYELRRFCCFFNDPQTSAFIELCIH